MAAVIGILCAVAIPQASAGLDRSRASVAARYLAAQMAVARTQAVARAASVAIRFGDAQSGFEMAMFVDGNANGVRTKDIGAGIDRGIAPAQRLGDRFPGVTVGLSADTGLGADPVRFGVSSLLTFTAVGTATAGSVYVLGRDGSQFVVRVVGATARTRVLRYLPTKGTWVEP